MNQAKHAAALHGGEATGVVPEQKPRKVSRRGRRVAWLMAMVAIGAMVGGVIVAGMKFIDGPVEATANKTSLAAAQATPTPKPTTSELSGLYIDMMYPGIFDIVSQLKNDAQALEQYNVASKMDYRRTIAVSVRPLATGKLDDDSSYRFRLINPADYEQSFAMVSGERVAIMTKQDHQEQTLFWAHEQKLVTVSITSSNPKDDIPAFMATIKANLRWRR